MLESLILSDWFRLRILSEGYMFIKYEYFRFSFTPLKISNGSHSGWDKTVMLNNKKMKSDLCFSQAEQVAQRQTGLSSYLCFLNAA